jgi:glycosyltransferase involved in cell wall biosynthesis
MVAGIRSLMADSPTCPELRGRQTRMVILFVTASFWDEPHRGRHHLASALNRRHTVIWVDRLLGLREKGDGRGGVHETAHNVTVFHPGRSFLPGRLEEILQWNNHRRFRKVIDHLDRHGIVPDLVWICDYHAVDFARHFKNRAPTLYFCNDYFGERSYRVFESELVKTVDHVFCTSPALADRYRKLNARTEFLPHGTWTTPVSAAFARKAVPETAGYVGTLRNIVDIGFLQSIVSEAGMKLVLAGPIIESTQKERAAFLSFFEQDQVAYLGNLDRDAARKAIGELDICLLPYLRTANLKYGFAIKYFDYLAMGKPMVATRYFDWPEPYGRFVSVYDSTQDLAMFLRDVYAKWDRDHFESALALARQSTWEDRIRRAGSIMSLDL